MVYLPSTGSSKDSRGTVWSGDIEGNIVVWSAKTGKKLYSLNTGTHNQPAQMGVVGGSLVACPGVVDGLLRVDFFTCKEGEYEDEAKKIVVEKKMSLELGTTVHEGEKVLFILPLKETCGSVGAEGCWVVTSKDRIFYYNTSIAQEFIRVKSMKKRSFSPISSGFAMGARRLYTGHMSGEVCVWEMSESFMDASLLVRSQNTICPITSLVVSPLLTMWTCSVGPVLGGQCEYPLAEWGLGLVPRKKISFGNGTSNGLWLSMQDGPSSGEYSLFIIASNFSVTGYVVNKEPQNWTESKLPS